MVTEVEVKVETRFGDLEMLVAVAPFNHALAALQRKKATLATGQQVAQARIVAGPEHNVSQHGSWVAENFVYFPSGQILVTHAENSPILKHPAEATAAYGSGKEFYISEEEAASLEKLAKSGEVYTLKKNERYKIPIKKFAKNRLARFVFGDATADYANFLQKASVNEVPVWLAGPKYQKEQKAPFAQALWLHYVGGMSGLGGNYRFPNSVNRARGVRKASTTQKSVDAANAYKLIAQKYERNSSDNLQEVMEKYSQIKGWAKA